jgi:hypothetical protein
MNDAPGVPTGIPTSIPRPLVTGPSAWVGPDLAQRPEEWTYTLSPAEIAEIEAATATVRRLGMDIADIRRPDFPLPTLGPVLDQLRHDVLNGRGFVLMRGLPVEGRPIADSATAYFGIGTYFGSARSQNAKGHVLGHVRDLVVFSACSHAGIVNVMHHVHATFPDVHLHAVMGGFHLSGPTEAIIPETVRDLGTFGLDLMIPAHCTGWRALNALERAYGEKVVVPSAVGKRFTL